VQIKTLATIMRFCYITAVRNIRSAFLVLLSRKGGVAEEGERGARKGLA
jgi:hypothetical protein